MAKPALDHVLRFNPPWRDDEKTECGRQRGDVGHVLTNDELRAKLKREGSMRAAYTTCMTCLDRAKLARPWNESPGAVIQREYGSWQGEDEDAKRELLAVGMLVQAHRQELRDLIAGLAGTSSLDERRRGSVRRLGGA